MRVLFIQLNIGTAPTGGVVVQKRNHAIYKELVGEHNVDLISLPHLQYPTKISKVKRAITRFIFANTWEISDDLHKNILSIINNYDVIHFDTSILGYLIRDIKKSGYKGIINAFFHNVEYSFNTVLAKKYGILGEFYSHPLKRSERLTCEWADHILALNKRDAEQISNLYGKNVSEFVPVTLKDSFHPYPSIKNTPLELLFVGSYFFANVASLLWFDKNVVPHLKNTKITVIGTGMSKIIPQIVNKQKFEIHDFVEDLGVYYQRASAVVLPIFEGGGMKIKTCESLMWGKYILGTTEAFQGYPITEKEGCVNDTADAFISTINRLAQEGIDSFCPSSRKLYEEQFTNDIIKRRIGKLLALHL